MDAKIAQAMHLAGIGIDSPRSGRKPLESLGFSLGLKKEQRLILVGSAQFPPSRNQNQSQHKSISCCYKSFPASVVESGKIDVPFDGEALILKNKSREIEHYLNGRSIYLVGMMGSGKTTVGKVLARALDYLFYDSDTLVEEDVGATSVAEIFKLYGEGYFRCKESEALHKLSRRHRLVVSTGGGAVIEDINWMHMSEGISVWLDVPLEELAQRIAAVGTDSRPLLHGEAGEAYTKALRRLSTLFQERHKAYAKAAARVSLENIATKLGYRDVSSIAPITIAIEVLEQIENFL